MERVFIIGNAGGGKSTLARKISKAHDLPYHEADSFMWTADWERVPEEEYEKAHLSIIETDKWVIDGNGFSANSMEKRVRRADFGILIDFPLWQHCWLVAERYMAWDKGEAEIVPAGHKVPPSLKDTFEMMDWVDREFTPKLRSLADFAEQSGCEIVRLTNFEALQEFSDQFPD